jgi:REP element-mobilizing transposase RayT
VRAAQRRQRVAVGVSPRTPVEIDAKPRSGGIEIDMAGTYSKLIYHIVFSTKHRQPFISAQIEAELYSYIGGIIRGIEGSCIEINGMPDHVHLLANLPPKIALSDALRDIKANSSKWVHETKPNLCKFSWQDGFSAFSLSKSQVEPVRQYIIDQKAHHAQRDYKSELLGLLDKHEVEFDERYIWD